MRKNKYFKLGLTAFIVVCLSMLFKYVLYSSTNFFNAIGAFVGVFSPIIWGLVLAYLIWPICKFIEEKCFIKYYHYKNKTIRHGDRTRFRIFSIIATLMLVISLIYAFFGTVLPEIYRSIENIIKMFPTYYDNVILFCNNFLQKTDIFVEDDVITLINNYSEDVYNFTYKTILPNATDLVKTFSNGVISAVNTVLNILIGLIIAIYLIASKEKFVGQAKKAVFSWLSKDKANNLMTDLRFIDKTFGGFLVGKIVDSIIIGILCFIGLSIIKMPYPVLISVIVGVTNVIPFFGPYLGAVPSTILIFLVSPKMALYFIIFIIILQQLDGNVIGPAILGNSIGVSSFWIIVSITVFGGFFGVFGMLIGVPTFACVYAFIRRQINTRLEARNMTIATSAYTTLDYIDENGEFVMFGEKSSLEESKRYIELTPNEHYDGSKTRKLQDIIAEFFQKVVDAIARLFKKKK